MRVVLIDDHTVLRDGLTLLLSLEPDIEVVGEAGTVRDGIALAERVRPHIVVTDVGLPDGDGVQVTSAVRERLPETRVLVLTVHDEDEYLLALIRAGASGYVLKNAAGSDLIRALRTVDSGQPWLQPAIARRLMQLTSGGGASPPKSGLAALIEPLTGREIEVLKLLAGAATNRTIAEQLGIGVRTVETHLANIYGKLGVRGRTEAMLWAIKERVVKTNDRPADN